jgi:hypothetical protein
MLQISLGGSLPEKCLGLCVTPLHRTELAVAVIAKTA